MSKLFKFLFVLQAYALFVSVETSQPTTFVHRRSVSVVNESISTNVTSLTTRALPSVVELPVLTAEANLTNVAVPSKIKPSFNTTELLNILDAKSANDSTSTVYASNNATTAAPAFVVVSNKTHNHTSLIRSAEMSSDETNSQNAAGNLNIEQLLNTTIATNDTLIATAATSNLVPVSNVTNGSVFFSNQNEFKADSINQPSLNNSSNATVDQQDWTELVFNVTSRPLLDGNVTTQTFFVHSDVSLNRNNESAAVNETLTTKANTTLVRDDLFNVLVNNNNGSQLLLNSSLMFDLLSSSSDKDGQYLFSNITFRRNGTEYVLNASMIQNLRLLSGAKPSNAHLFTYQPAWFIGLTVIGCIIAIFFLGCIVAICYTRRPYRKSGKVYEVESASKKNANVPQIPNHMPSTKITKSRELYY